MGEFFDSLFGITTEHHADGSKTERFDTGGAITSDKEGNTLEYSRPENSGIFGFGGGPVQVTYDGDGKIINVQERK